LFPGVGWWAKAHEIVRRLADEGRLAPTDAWMVEEARQRAAAEGEAAD